MRKRIEKGRIRLFPAHLGRVVLFLFPSTFRADLIPATSFVSPFSARSARKSSVNRVTGVVHPFAGESRRPASPTPLLPFSFLKKPSDVNHRGIDIVPASVRFAWRSRRNFPVASGGARFVAIRVLFVKKIASELNEY